MGQRGSDVSREVADLVLLDDNFATIVSAITEGRSIYDNIQKFLRFLFSTNLSEVLLVSLGALFAFALSLRDATGAIILPLTAAQILWINLMTDGLPALALAFDRSPGVMQRPPRPADSPLLDRPSTLFVTGVGTMKALLALAVLGLVPRLGYELDVARAVTFHFMSVGQLLLTYPSRRTWTSPLHNPYLHGAVLVGIGIQVAAASWPVVAESLGNAAIPHELWGIVFGGALLSWVLAEAIARVVWRSPEATRTSELFSNPASTSSKAS
jgi:Ca2+-transporting ATPase